MATAPTYPGVYIEEIPSGVHPIRGVATSIAAFVDFFRRGPMNEAVQLFSFADFTRVFGGLDSRSEASYGIQQFFLNGGNECWAVRVASAATDNAPTAAEVTAQWGDLDSDALTFTAKSAGEWGNRGRARIDHGTSDPANLFNLTLFEVEPRDGRIVVVGQEDFKELSMAPTHSRFVESVVNAGSMFVNVTAHDAAPPAGNDPRPAHLPAQSGTVADADFEEAAGSGALTTHAKLTYNEAGFTFDEADVDLGPGPIGTVDEAASRLEAGLRAALPSNPAWSGATVRAVGQRLQVLPGTARPATVASFADADSDTTTSAALHLDSKPDPDAGSAADPPPDPAYANVTAYALGATTSVQKQGTGEAGQDGVAPDATALMGSAAVSPPTGIFALDKVDLFNVLCLPRIGRRDGPDAFPEAQVGTVLSAAENYCESRRAFFVLDTPSNVTNVLQFKQWLTGTLDAARHRNAAVYFPRIVSPDPLDDFRPRSFGASGSIAGLYGRTDAARGVWKAPAGTEATIRNVQRLEYKLTDAENGVLNPLGINCLRTFDVYGHVCWGARTLVGSDQQASEWKYVPVRRFALFLEESLFRGTKWVVFEPNDEPLWAQIRLNVGAFMHDLFRKGAFQGQTPREAYLVKCDAETTTQTDIDNGVVNILVGFAPLKPAEFVIVQIQQLAGQIET
jgi:Bacteriophage tail sheath protein